MSTSEVQQRGIALTLHEISILIAHPKPARFKDFKRLWRAGLLAHLPPAEVRIDFAYVKRAERLQAQVVGRRPDILVVYGSLLGDQPAHAAMWALTQGIAGVLITDDSDPSRQFKTKRCHVLPVQGRAEETAEVLALEVARVRQERHSSAT